MEGNEEKELLEEMMVVETLVRDNPCGMPSMIMSSLKAVLHDFIGKHCIQGASRTQVAKYFKKDVRTVTRWKTEYSDFPEARHDGHKEVTYNWSDVIAWKLKHKDLFL